jgi:hypothetical protein
MSTTDIVGIVWAIGRGLFEVGDRLMREARAGRNVTHDQIIAEIAEMFRKEVEQSNREWAIVHGAKQPGSGESGANGDRP